LLREGFAEWRRRGPVRGTARAIVVLARLAYRAMRAQWLRLRPVRASRREVEAALGGVPAREALRGPVLAAMPTVAEFERSLDALDDAGRASLIARADAVLAHRFDLLGSGPVELGPQIDWQLDFKSGRRWPLRHISLVTISYPDDSDIKVPWELSRFQHLPLLAATWRVTGERRYLDELGAQLEDWIERNPVEFGANWACTMDVAIRAANWVAALAMVADDAHAEPWFERALVSLLLHGRFIRSHLEWANVRGNHYLSDVVGLTPLAALFSGSAEGRAWADWAAAELMSEMDHQVHADGCDHEASIPYHRLVCELFVCGTQAVDALIPGRLPDRFRERLDLMLQFTADYTRPDGLAPQVGDADDGRYLPLDDYAKTEMRRHRHLFRQAGGEPPAPRGHLALREGGYYVIRFPGVFVLVRCGDTGMRGIGGHAHNDQLSFELVFGDAPVVVDPGAYLYTAAPEERNRFRSTAYHSTLRIGGGEQNELSPVALFSLPDRSRAEATAWEPGERVTVFEGRHHGFEALDPPALHARRLTVDGQRARVEIEDRVSSAGPHELEWTFPLLPQAQVELVPGGATVRVGETTVMLDAGGLDVTIEDGWYSPSFGRREAAHFIRSRGRSEPPEHVARLSLELLR
jgi:heparinase II/III-like protein